MKLLILFLCYSGLINKGQLDLHTEGKWCPTKFGVITLIVSLTAADMSPNGTAQYDESEYN